MIGNQFSAVLKQPRRGHPSFPLGSSSRHRGLSQLFLIAGCWLLVAGGVSGCEALQRKLTRKPKHPGPPPSPVINFQDYTQTTTPLDRYRKHYLLFEYWNHELMDALNDLSLNFKRYRRASTESLAELGALHELVLDDLAVGMTPLIDARSKIDHQLQSSRLNSVQANALVHALDAQARQMHRQFFWRTVQDQLKDTSHAPAH